MGKEHPMSLSVDDALAGYDVHFDQGLTDQQVEASRKKHGLNEIPEGAKKSIWKLVLEQFDDLLVKILLAAAVISLLLAITEENEEERQTAFVEPVVIMVILILNAVVGVWQERGAEMALDALKQYDPNMAKVMRNGEVTMITSEEVVPGDVLMVRVGDKIAADSRVVQVESMTLRAEQATLTGEAASVLKDTDAVSADSDINSRTNMLFKGTAIEYGTCKAVVVSTGLSTEFGKIHASLSEDDEEDSKTPLKRKLDEFGELLSKVITVICILVWLMNINHFSEHGDWVRGAVYYFKIAVALAVAAIPEGLPAVVTTCLSLGTAQMAKKNAIVRSLPAVETLGCTTVICSDKTGTLTTNKMSVVKVLVPGSGKSLIEYDVDGDSFAPEGALRTGGEEVEGASVGHLRDVANVCALCNDSSIVYNEKTESYEKVGEATEAALKVLVEKIYGGSTDSNMGIRAGYHNKKVMSKLDRKATLEFSRDRKSMSVYCVAGNGAGDAPETPRRSARQASLKSQQSGDAHMFVKGAPESVLDRCTKVRNADGTETALTPAIRKVLDEKLVDYSTGSTTLRCLALAVIDNPSHRGEFNVKSSADFIEYEQDMTFIGIVGLIDPPRLEVRGSIHECRKAFIRVVVITGDNKGTAEAICRRIGVFDEDESTAGKSFTGKELSQMTTAQKLECVKTARLFSRTEPMHKRELVELLQSQGEVVAMTGDGVNDAPALKKADIGVAMGSGTEVAKGASEMVLADDNFSTIVAAVEEGRAIYANTKQFIRYLISSNIGEVVCIFFAAMLGIPEVLVPVQLLWVNLVTDGLPATALSFNPPDPDIMKRAPRSASEQIVNGWMFFRYMSIGVYVGVATVAAYIWWFLYYSKGPLMKFSELTDWENCENQTYANGFDCEVFEHRGPSTMSLSVLVAVEMLNAFNSLSEDQSLLAFPPYKNWYLVGACVLSCSLHAMILVLPFFNTIFHISPLGYEEWECVLMMSLPVLVMDELLKLVSRMLTKDTSRSKKEE